MSKKSSFYRDDITFLNMPDDEEDEHSDSLEQENQDLNNFLNIEFNFDNIQPLNSHVEAALEAAQNPLEVQIPIDQQQSSDQSLHRNQPSQKFAATPNTALALLNRKQGKKPPVPIPVVMPDPVVQQEPQFNFNLDDETMATIYSQILATVQELPQPPTINLQEIQPFAPTFPSIPEEFQEYPNKRSRTPKISRSNSVSRKKQDDQPAVLLPTSTNVDTNNVVAYSPDLVNMGVIDEETDKRIRNNAASARFRAKKKLREQALAQIAKESVSRLEDVEKQLAELTLERDQLRQMVLETHGTIPTPPQAPVVLSEELQNMKSSLADLGVEVDEGEERKKKRGKKIEEVSIALTSTTDSNGRKVFAPAVVPVAKKK